MSRAFTKEEVRSQLFQYLFAMIDYWDKVEGHDAAQKMEGLAFSILNVLDGTAAQFPAIDLVLRSHPDDKAYHQENDENWYEDGMAVNDDVMLHEIFCHFKPNR